MRQLLFATTLLAGSMSIHSCSSKTEYSSATPTTLASTPATKTTASFDVDSAMTFIRHQVEFGPRVPGTSAHSDCVDWMAGKLKSFTDVVIDTPETMKHPVSGETVPVKNVFARINPEATKRILLLAHYDTRPWADEDPVAANHNKPIDGANDGASGVGVAMEIARNASKQLSATLGLDILLVDQEDSGSYGDDESWCLGSTLWASNIDRYYTTANRPVFAILLDMVGGKGAQFQREAISDYYFPYINNIIWQTAAQSQYASYFPDRVGGAITDDHIPLLKAGIPAVNIIDTRSGGFNPTWHTMQDNMDNIDPATVEAVGNVITNVIYSQQ